MKMKKIIALILALCCLFAVVSCSGNPNLDEASAAQIEAVLRMIDDSIPTKSVTETIQTIGNNVVIKSKASLVTGQIDGKAVSKYDGQYSSLRAVGNAFNMTEPEIESRWYVEGLGVSTDKGQTYDETKGDFAPNEGFIKLKISQKIVSEASYDEKTGILVMKIDKENATKVVSPYLERGQTIDSDLVVTIVTAGGRITGIKLEYTIPAHTIDVENSDVQMEVQDTQVVIDAKYEYNHQKITLE